MRAALADMLENMDQRKHGKEGTALCAFLLTG